MKAKQVYVLSTPRTIMGIYESEQDATNEFNELFDLVDDLRITVETVIPDFLSNADS